MSLILTCIGRLMFLAAIGMLLSLPFVLRAYVLQDVGRVMGVN